MLQQLYKNREIILKKSQEFFLNSNSLIPKIGIELEFFLLQKNLQAIENQDLLAKLIAELKTIILQNFHLMMAVEKEQGISQIEIKSEFTADLLALAREIEGVKKFIKNWATNKNIIASFAAQPFLDDCGNALQFNISLHDKEGGVDDKFLAPMIAGLLFKTNQMMIFLAPKAEDYERFSFETNRNLFKKGKYSAPVNLSFGADNRTCAIRIPKARKNKCLEYRVACAEADPFLSMAAILEAMKYGIKNQLDPIKLGFYKVFGNAFDEQYQIKSFCRNLEEAKEFFNQENMLNIAFP